MVVVVDLELLFFLFVWWLRDLVDNLQESHLDLFQFLDLDDRLSVKSLRYPGLCLAWSK